MRLIPTKPHSAFFSALASFAVHVVPRYRKGKDEKPEEKHAQSLFQKVPMRKLIMLVILCWSGVAAHAQQSQSLSSTGNITAAGSTCATTNACINLTLITNTGGTAITVSGTWSGTLKPEQSADNGVTWSSAGADITSNGLTTYTVVAMTNFRVRASAFASGTALVFINSGATPGSAAGTINGVVVSGTPTVGQVPTATSANTATWQTGGGGSCAEGTCIINAPAGNQTITNAHSLINNGPISASKFQINGGDFVRQLSSTTTTVGPGALGSTSTMDDSVAVGLNAMFLNTGVAGSNTAIGVDALYSYQGGSATAVGIYSLNSATTNENTAIGTSSGVNVTTGSANVVAGNAALGLNNATPALTGTGNVALGDSSLGILGGASNYNTAVGHTAGSTLTTGSFNVLLGRNTQTNAVTDSNSIVIGNSQTGGGSNTVNLGGILTATGISTPSTSTVTIPEILSLTGAAVLGTPTSLTLTNATGLKWNNHAAPSGNLSLTMAGNTSTFNTTTALSQFFAWKNTTAAVVGTSQGSPVLATCGRAFHGSADVEDCMNFSELPGNGNDAAILQTIGHTGTSTAPVTLIGPSGGLLSSNCQAGFGFGVDNTNGFGFNSGGGVFTTTQCINGVIYKLSTNGPGGNHDIYVSGATLQWSSGNPNVSPADLGISRSAAGVLSVGTGAAANSAGSLKSLKVLTDTNCSNAASPAVCATASAGVVAVPTGTNPTLTINTTAVTAASEIFLQIDESATIAATTCNTTLSSLVQPVVTARTAATSFTIQIGAVIASNPVCVSYHIIN